MLRGREEGGWACTARAANQSDLEETNLSRDRGLRKADLPQSPKAGERGSQAETGGGGGAEGAGPVGGLAERNSAEE